MTTPKRASESVPSHSQIPADAGCTKAEAQTSIFDKAELQKTCFDGETYVLVGGRSVVTGEETLSWREIWHVKVGDEVLSRCEATCDMAYKKVIKVCQREHAEVFDVWYDCGPEYRAYRGRSQQPILTTADHPFWVEGKGWVEVGHLQPGDAFLTHNGIRATVDKVEKKSYRVEVYNLEIEDFHTYFVGYEGIWVHGWVRDTGLGAAIIREHATWSDKP